MSCCAPGVSQQLGRYVRPSQPPETRVAVQVLRADVHGCVSGEGYGFRVDEEGLGVEAGCSGDEDGGAVEAKGFVLFVCWLGLEIGGSESRSVCGLP